MALALFVAACPRSGSIGGSTSSGDGWDATVYMCGAGSWWCEEATTSDEDAVERGLAGDPKVAAFDRDTVAEVLERAEALPDRLDELAHRVSPTILGPGFGVDLVDPRGYDEFATEYMPMSGVDSVVSHLARADAYAALRTMDNESHFGPVEMVETLVAHGLYDVSIFLCDENTCGEMTTRVFDDLQQRLESDPLIQNVVYESKEEALENFRRIFVEDPEIVANVTAEELPASFRITVTDPAAVAVIVDRYAAYAGVEEIYVEDEVIQGPALVTLRLVREAVG